MNWKRLKETINKKVKRQIMVVYIMVTVIPLFLLGILALGMLRGQLKKSYEMQLEAECIRVKGTLFDITSSVYSFSEPIVSVQLYRDIFSKEVFGSDEKQVYNSLTNFMTSIRQSTAAVSSMYIYTNNPNIPSNTCIRQNGDSFEKYDWYQKMKPGVWDTWVWTTAQVNRTQQDEELTMVRRINTGSEDYCAYLVIAISSNHLRNRILKTDSFIMASLDDFNCIFSTDYKAEEQPMPLTENAQENHYNYMGPYRLNGETVLTTTSAFHAYITGDQFFILVSDRTAYQQMDLLTKILALTLSAAFLCTGIVVFLFATFFSKRVETLRIAMNRAGQGDYNIADEFYGADELTDIFNSLKTMVQKVRKREAEYYETKLEEQRLLNMQQEMEFKMLSSQINPHFLYNTLELIRMQAVSQKNKHVADSILLLARSMHYVLENTGTEESTLEKEFEHVKTYLRIQQMRFGARVNWDFYIENGIDVSKYRILPILIQPVVENAIIHGLEEIEENGHISIILEKEDNRFLITVRDNGAGVEKEQLERIRGDLCEKKKGDCSSIGLFNINQRIKVRYGSEYGVQIDSEQGAGTTVCMTVPVIPVEGESDYEQDAQRIDRR